MGGAAFRYGTLFLLLLLIAVVPWSTPSAAASEGDGTSGNDTGIYLVLGILLLAAVLFLTEAIPIVATAMLVPSLLVMLRLVTFEEAFAGFADRWVLLFLFMFIIGDSLFQTGIADRMGRSMVRHASGKERGLVVHIMLVAGVMSAFLSNTGTAACLLPITVAVSRSSGVPLRRLLLPMAFATSLGGSLTVIGTPPNGIVQSTYEGMTGTNFGFFEYAKVGIFVFAAGMLFLALLGRRLIPAGADGGVEERSEPVDGSASGGEGAPGGARIAAAVFLLVVFSMAMAPVWPKLFPSVSGYFGGIPLTAYAVIGVVVLFVTRVMTVEKAFAAVDWRTIFLFAGMLSLKPALLNTGAADFMAGGMIGFAGSLHLSPDHATLAMLVLASAVVTNFMSNTATAALLAPVAMEVAVLMGCSPAPLLMGVALGCSACFLTPVATPPNTLVLGPGGYSFGDYLRAGWILQMIVIALLIVLIPFFFPF
ncbi:MAG: hypothetical protein AVO35_09735 [Candidatus Aegiribacteria sp. MLS_C]|nr:MAG: hypothetical protein AVO35_09735 [Candidatus Aegiribacteria sp. MLS_C]